MQEKEVNQLHAKIIDLILNSELNIELIPDELERKLYESLLEVLQKELVDKRSTCLFNLCKKKKGT